MTEKQEKLLKKVQKDFPEFVDAVAGLSVEDLDARLLAYAKEAEIIESSKEEKIGRQLEELAEQKKLLEGPFKDAAKANKLKQKYLILMIEEKGGDVGK